VLRAGGKRGLAPEQLKRLVKTFDSNHRAVTFTIAKITVGKTARIDLLLKLEILRIDLSLRESFCNHRLIEGLGLLSRIDPEARGDQIREVR
jgi:hypothetical protein